jgi:hypothetical protein
MGKLSDTIAAELEPEPENPDDNGIEREVKDLDPEMANPEGEDRAPEKPAEKKEEKKESEGGEQGASSQPPKEPAKADKPEKKEERPAPPLKFKIKFEDEEREYDDPEEIRVLAQKGFAADKRFREASAMRKEAQEFLQRVKTDPMSALEEVFSSEHDGERGIELLRQKAIDWLRPWAQTFEMTPEQRAMHEERQRLERERKAFESEKARKQAEYNRKVAEQAQQTYIKEIESAFKQHGLEESKINVRKVARLLRESMDFELGITPADAVLQVKREIDSQKAKDTPPPSLDEALKDAAKREEIKQKIAALEKPPSTPPFPSTPKKDEDQKEPKERASRKAPYSTKRNFHDALEQVALHG